MILLLFPTFSLNFIYAPSEDFRFINTRSLKLSCIRIIEDIFFRKSCAHRNEPAYIYLFLNFYLFIFWFPLNLKLDYIFQILIRFLTQGKSYTKDRSERRQDGWGSDDTGFEQFSFSLFYNPRCWGPDINIS